MTVRMLNYDHVRSTECVRWNTWNIWNVFQRCSHAWHEFQLHLLVIRSSRWLLQCSNLTRFSKAKYWW